MKVLILLFHLSLVITLTESHTKHRLSTNTQNNFEKTRTTESIDELPENKKALGKENPQKLSRFGGALNVFKMWKKNHLDVIKSSQIEFFEKTTKDLVDKYKEILDEYPETMGNVLSQQQDEISVNETNLEPLVIQSMEALLRHTYLNLARNLTDEIRHQLGLALIKHITLNSHKNFHSQELLLLGSVTPWCSKEDVILDRGEKKIPRFRLTVRCNGKETTCRKSGIPSCTAMRNNLDVLVLKGFTPPPNRTPIYKHEREQIVTDCICRA